MPQDKNDFLIIEPLYKLTRPRYVQLTSFSLILNLSGKRALRLWDVWWDWNFFVRFDDWRWTRTPISQTLIPLFSKMLAKLQLHILSCTARRLPVATAFSWITLQNYYNVLFARISSKNLFSKPDFGTYDISGVRIFRSSTWKNSQFL